MTKRIGIADRTISIGFVGSLLFGLLSRIVFLFKQQHPQLKIEMVEMNTSEQIQALKEGRIDVGFGRLRISDPAVKRVLLREERLMVAAHSSHFLSHRDGVNLTELVDQPLFLYPNNGKANFSTQVRGIFSEYGLEPKISVQSVNCNWRLVLWLPERASVLCRKVPRIFVWHI